MTEDINQSLMPFLKWAGGKRWLATNYPHFLPKNFNRYIEPFLGGGAIFFSMQPRQAVLSDANPRLIECYLVMRDDPQGLLARLLRHQKFHGHQYYYDVRSKNYRSAVGRAAQFLYLNRTCWNGLYRVNLNGKFNVPKGTKSTVVFPNEDFSVYSQLLRRAVLRSGDFEGILDTAKAGDFVFVDPPYTVKHNNNGFAKYNENIFSWADQIRLQEALGRAGRRGAKILLCNAHHESVMDLFANLGELHIVRRTSLIAGESSRRDEVTEIVVTINYENWGEQRNNRRIATRISSR
jgi:DNA adenine methylase